MTSRGGSGVDVGRGCLHRLGWGGAGSPDVQRLPHATPGGASTPSPHLATPAPTDGWSFSQKPLLESPHLPRPSYDSEPHPGPTRRRCKGGRRKRLPFSKKEIMHRRLTTEDERFSEDALFPNHLDTPVGADSSRPPPLDRPL